MTREPFGDEAVRLERELARLRCRQASMLRWGKVLRLYVLLLPVPLFGLIFVALRIDQVAGLFFIGVMGLIAALVWVARGGGPARGKTMAAAPRGIIRYGNAAEAVEDLIATRERRLAELKGARG